MVRRSAMTATQFAAVFAPMALEGKSALEIGQALGVEGDADKIAQFVSVKASQLRARMAKDAETKAKAQNLSKEDTEKLVAATVAKLPKLRSRGRQSGTAELISLLDSVLSSVNGDKAEDAPATETTPETETASE